MLRAGLGTAIALLVLGPPGTEAQAPRSFMHVLPQSRLWLEGSSNINSFTCRTSSLSARASMSAPRPGELPGERPLVSAAELTLPVRSLKCGNRQIEGNMYRALNADEFPVIKYVLRGYELHDVGHDDGAVAIRTTGTLIINGHEREIAFDIVGSVAGDGVLKGVGEVELRMTSFGIEPPVLMLGAVRTSDRIVVGFELIASPELLYAGFQR